MEAAPSLLTTATGTQSPLPSPNPNAPAESTVDPVAAAAAAAEGESSTPRPSSSSTDATAAPSPVKDDREPVAGTSEATATQTTAERAFQHGLNRENLEQEVGQVMGTLKSWWKTSPFQNLREEVDKTLAQAKSDLDYLRTAKVEVVRKDPAEFRAEQERDKAEKKARAASLDKGKGKEVDLTDDTEPQEAGTAGTFTGSASALFKSLSSSTTQLQHSLQHTLQTTLASAQNNPALSNPSQLRAQLAENLRLSSARQNLQMSMKQAEKLAEDYMKKGDQWVKDAEKWMEEAVKIVPPEDGDRMVGMSWDGSDFYSFSTSATPRTKEGDVIFDAKNKTPRPSMSGVALAGSRKEALLRRLREDKDLLLVDPEGEAESAERRDEFKTWVEKEWPIEGPKGRKEEEGNVGGIRMALVPEQLTDEQFWQRYLFHKHMIEAEDEKRKKVLQASQQAAQDDFSWDDEAEDPSPVAPLAQSTTTLRLDSETPEAQTAAGSETEAKAGPPTPKAHTTVKVPSAPAPAAKVGGSTSTSPRDSEESYDLVSDQGQRGSKVATPAVGTEDEDSDWE